MVITAKAAMEGKISFFQKPLDENRIEIKTLRLPEIIGLFLRRDPGENPRVFPAFFPEKFILKKVSGKIQIATDKILNSPVISV